jgi:hypothetical protein
MNSHKTFMAAVSTALILRPAWSWAQTATEPINMIGITCRT